MPTKLLQVVAVFCGTLLILSLLTSRKEPANQPIAWQPQPYYPENPYNPPLQKPQEPQAPITVEPKFENYPAIRQPDSSLGKVLSDIECHMPAGHIYRDSDKITWGHETSHGLASKIRQKFSQGNGAWKTINNKPTYVSFARINGFYVLNDRAVVIEEPNTTIRATASLVPRSLRGSVYNLYMVQQAGSWNNIPLYIFDEWVAYANGSAVRADLKIQKRSETVQYMMEFCVYSICVGWSSKTEDEQFKNFVKWHLKRAMDIKEDNRNIGDISRADAYWEKVKTSSDAEEFRRFTRQYLGEDWVKQVLDF